MLNAFAILAGGIVIIIYGIAQWDRLNAARRWTRVEGEIYAARVIEDTPDPDYGKRYRADIRYGYFVDGVELAGSKLQLITMASSSHADAQVVVRSYPPGRRVTVYCDPRNPHDAVLEIPARGIVPLLLVVAGVVVGLVGFYKWWSWYTE
jgi:hypothetical protein